MISQKTNLFCLYSHHRQSEKYQLIFYETSHRLWENQTVILTDHLGAITWAEKSGNVQFMVILSAWPMLTL